MQHLHYELEILAKCIHFKNLSAAAIHVGLSQPQLSRIISKVETEMKVVLLDRAAKRKSGWTPLAFELSKLYEKNMQRLELELTLLTKNESLSELRIGSLEGLSHLAMNFAKIGFDDIGIKKIILDIYDLNDLEANFMSGNLDIILTSKIPGKQKYSHLYTIGYQQFENIETNRAYQLFTAFEYNKKEKKVRTPSDHILISNSLAIKKEWLKIYGGVASLPTAPKKSPLAGDEPILLIASELIGPKIWEKLLERL